ncbi:uncharacterized protein MYCFIDRAFT_84643 [Pseudocercospora fijiensis CIRAD86]|uniref:BTB domain-containing protein n=1 Tax=Pseudocercospora fijiensis (strain CIRAD86) TaxID=383855 RepID=M2ZNE5_PSEFD|nr:uncharacterized protein MYCFIDRAFT_84643 [Pseudocercospora fijiensis CIRAD86]EME80619.1 hypothetical protein MYCFIDRAFT_84643 [Pseudocercospora fijiensis CIRAD86]
MSSNAASIYVKHNNGRVELVAKIDKQKLCLFSRHADRRFKSAPTRDRSCTEPSPFLVHQPAHLDVDIIPSIRIIVRWIEEYDEANPAPLNISMIPNPPSPGTLGPWIGPDIKQAVDLYFTCFHIFVDRHRRGDLLHRQIKDYTKQSSISLNEFQMISEILSFDTALIHSMMNQVIYDSIKGKSVPEWEKIKQYCIEVGKWQEMCKIAEDIVKKIQDAKETDAGRKGAA